MTTPLSTAYMRFLELSRAIRENETNALTANQKALLELVSLAWHSGAPMSVRQAIALSQLGSPATLHKRLAFLRNSGYLEEISVEGDRRTKLLGPTEKTLRLFEQLGGAMALNHATRTSS